MGNRQQSDEELMVQYQNGSMGAFTTLFERHRGKVYGFLLKKTKSEVVASDLLQEVFMKVHKSKELYNSKFPVLPWFFSITNSVFIDYVRSEKKQKAIHNYDFNSLSAQDLSPTQGIFDLQPLMQQLPDHQRQALQMRYAEEKSFEEIAQKLNTSSLNTRQMISRGIRQLKKLIQKESKS